MARDSLQVIFSGTKGLVAACVLKLIERGQLDLDAASGRYWPEFAQHGKDRVRVRHVVSHGAGLPGIATAACRPPISPTPEQMEQLLAGAAAGAGPERLSRLSCAYGRLACRGAGAPHRRPLLGQFFAEEFARRSGSRPGSGCRRAGDAGRQDPAGRALLRARSHEEQLSNPVLRSIWGNPPLFPDDDWRGTAARTCGRNWRGRRDRGCAVDCAVLWMHGAWAGRSMASRC